MSLAIRLRHDFPSIRMDMAFETPTPGVTVLFGPSGAGKSTIIIAAAGLLRPDECRVAVDGQVLADTAPYATPTAEQNPEIWRDASPVYHVAKSNAPFLIVHGAEDPSADGVETVSIDGVEAFYVTHTQDQTELLAERCAARGLLSTGSADFHGPDNRLFSRFLAFETYGLEPNLGPIAA